jgi:hypothetical protein
MGLSTAPATQDCLELRVFQERVSKRSIASTASSSSHQPTKPSDVSGTALPTRDPPARKVIAVLEAFMGRRVRRATKAIADLAVCVALAASLESPASQEPHRQFPNDYKNFWNVCHFSRQPSKWKEERQMSSSILNDVKHTLGLLPENTAFDTDIIMHINSAISTLTQLGVGPVAGYAIADEDNTWDEFADDVRLNSVRSYIYLKVKLIFDPPATGFATASYERQIQELEYRINVVVDYG